MFTMVTILVKHLSMLTFAYMHLTQSTAEAMADPGTCPQPPPHPFSYLC